MLYYVIIALHISACLFLIGVVLLQQGKGQDLASAFGGGGSQTAFGPRGSANVLSRATAILAGLFMVTSLSLSLLKSDESSILDQLPAGPPSPAASPIAGTAGTTPATDTESKEEAGSGTGESETTPASPASE